MSVTQQGSRKCSTSQQVQTHGEVRLWVTWEVFQCRHHQVSELNVIRSHNSKDHSPQSQGAKIFIANKQVGVHLLYIYNRVHWTGNVRQKNGKHLNKYKGTAAARRRGWGV